MWLKKPRSPCYFSSCFGFSRKEEFSGKISSVNKSSNSRKETTCIFSWSMSCMKNSSAKTVPLDASDRSTDLLSETKIPSSKSSNCKSKWKIRRIFTTKPPTDSTTKATPFREVTTIVNEIIEETTQRPEKNNVRLSSFDQVATSKDATCRKRLSFRRKKDTNKTGSSQPDSPDIIIKPHPKPARINTATTSSHSLSTPVPTHEKRVKQLSNDRVGVTKTRRVDHVVVVNKFDPLVGMSIIVVTLIIMSIWGRLCAILCTSAWLYFVPRLQALENDFAAMKINGGDLDLNSAEYKKRVVLEGFLERDHRALL